MATRKRPRKKKTQRGRRAWLLFPVIILAVMLGWLYRSEIVSLVTFDFKGIDFTRPPEDSARSDRRISEKERKELEKILEKR